jgi:threonine synthase
MDIQVPSNFERLLFELKGCNGAAAADQMRLFREHGSTPEDEQAWRMACTLFSAHRVDDTRTVDTIRETYARSGVLIDPHTAIAVAAARAEMSTGNSSAPMVALACAHPAKFPDVVERGTGVRPALPAFLSDILKRRERRVVLPNDLGAVTRFIHTRARHTGNS